MSDISKIAPSEFPPLLQEISDPPKELFVRGPIDVLYDDSFQYLTVVGSRKYSTYGKDACEKLINGLAGHKIVIISGLALGMDAIAHQAALDTHLPTIAVPGSGLNWSVLHPKTNHPLAHAILDAGGAHLSEYAPDFKATPWSFPQRNRIMVGLAHAVLVIEATEKSGTLITAKLTTDYDRDLLCVPGSIFSANSAGPHQFIKLGATPVTSSGDILDALHIDTTDSATQNTLDLDSYSPDEQRVLELLASPLHKDELIKQLRTSAREANILISSMELKGLLIEHTGEIRRL